MTKNCAIFFIINFIALSKGLPTSVDETAIIDKWAIDPPTLPEFPPEISLPDIPETEVDSPIFRGTLSISNGKLNGLDKLADTIEIGFGGFGAVKIEMTVTVPEVEMNGEYTLLGEMFLDEFGNYSASGTGPFTFTVDSPKFEIVAKFKYLDPEIETLTVGLEFDDIRGHASNFELNGQPVEWESFLNEIEAVFRKYWSENNSQITENLRIFINYVIEDCSLGELIEIVEGGPRDCLQFPETTK